MGIQMREMPDAIRIVSVLSPIVLNKSAMRGTIARDLGNASANGLHRSNNLDAWTSI